LPPGALKYAGALKKEVAMNKILFCFFSVIVFISMAGCSTSSSSASNTDPNKIISVKVGQEFTIALKSNPTTGYGWECTSVYEWIQPLDKTYKADNTGLVGSGGTDIFRFKAHGQGKAKLDFVYKRSWETTSLEQKSFTVEVIS
jgi:inhibitor of cysteine peptidase